MKSKKNLIIVALVIMLSLFGTTYAYFRYYKESANQKIVTGKVNLVFNEGTDTINLSNVFPETTEEARKRTDNVITFTVSGYNTTTNKDIWYEIMLNEGTEEEGKTRYNPEYLVFDLSEVNGDTETLLVDSMSYSDFNKKRIWVDTVLRDTSLELNKTYKLRMWLSNDVIISDTYEGAHYTTEEFKNTYGSVKVSVYGDFKEKEMSVLLSDRVMSTISLTEADVDGTRFVYGADVDNNYVWYSGKLWRIVSIDEDGSIKLVTQGNMTTIAWSTSSSTDYSTSQVRTWLNNEFLPTLYNAENLLVDYEWDYTTYTDFPTQKAAENIMKLTGEDAEKVGLINIYEYMMTGGNTSSTTTNTFLNNGYHWCTMSPSSIVVWSVYIGYAEDNLDYNFGIRPSVNLKSGITILGGTGEKTSPYTIKGDKETGTTSELLLNRISGEYINFNNTKYRIVGIETIEGEQLTKVTMADYDNNKKNVLTTSIRFNYTMKYSTSDGVGKYLLDWYNATEESDVEGTYVGLYIDKAYKDMIATPADGDNVVWYTGPSSGIDYDYTLSKSGTTVETPIGLGYYGEVFSSQFGEGYGSSTDTWLMTAHDESNGFTVRNAGSVNPIVAVGNSSGARPSFYLKSDVKIGDVDGDGDVGTGKSNDPYEIVYEFINTPAPKCTISGDTATLVGHNYTYNIKCTDTDGFSDSEITTSDITISNSSVLSISTPVKSTITNGYKYTITVTPLASGTTTISLNAGSVSDTFGNSNVLITSNSITISEGPVCKFVSSYYEIAYAISYDNPAVVELECTSDSGFIDSEIETSDIEFYDTFEEGISTPDFNPITKTAIDNGYRYTISFYYIQPSIYKVTLKEGSVTNSSGGNGEVYTEVDIVP